MFLFLIIVSAFSCAKRVSQENVNTIPKEPVKEAVVGADADSHGCKASAGYTWSTLKKECIRVFEGTKLSHLDDGKTYTTASYVIFEGNKAELFLDTQKESIILERKSEGDSWVNGDWELIPWKGYVLKKDGKIIYTGK
ncbi:hypothetical protein IR010_04330 [Flavobacterium sp. MR2016-29]|nr:hypothetical protein [Flavobacterium sp. MR2016-29]